MVLKSLNTVDQIEEEKKSPAAGDHLPHSDVPLSGSTGQNKGRSREHTAMDSIRQAIDGGK